jgi:2-dehydro-3-deoxy-D-arabinonate dehydratase
MRIIRYADSDAPRLAAVKDTGEVYPLPAQDFMQWIEQVDREGKKPLAWLADFTASQRPLELGMDELSLLVPVVAPEVWAAGVTYERSRQARNYEATAGKMDATTFYDKVYEADRPELFMKSTAARTVGPGETLCLRSDSQWQIPEPELGLVLRSNGEILGYTVGNDMSCRDIEGENPLYLPQAKIWKRSCSIGPAILLAESVSDPYRLDIRCRIYRNDQLAVDGQASTGQLKRKLEELVAYLVRDNVVFDGTVLLTGTCIVPPNEFTLAAGDRIEIEISGIGTLVNPVGEA